MKLSKEARIFMSISEEALRDSCHNIGIKITELILEYLGPALAAPDLELKGFTFCFEMAAEKSGGSAFIMTGTLDPEEPSDYSKRVLNKMFLHNKKGRELVFEELSQAMLAEAIEEKIQKEISETSH